MIVIITSSSIDPFVLWNDTSFALPHLSLYQLHEQGVQYSGTKKIMFRSL